VIKLSQPGIVIVGGGPAGLATALYLAQRDPALAAHTLILEARNHPRPKLCGGGITVHGEEQLERLGLHLDVRAFTAHRLIFRLGKRDFIVDYPDAMRVIERAVFDAALAEAVQAQGIQLNSGERVLDLQLCPDHVELTTNVATYRPRVIVAADGANSTIRRKLKMFNTVGIARLLRTMTPVDPQQEPLWRDQAAVFDFSPVLHGIQGYMWDFPTYVGDQPFINRGIFDSRIVPQPATEREHGAFKRAFARGLHDRALDPDATPLEGHPVRWFQPDASFSQPHVLLVGDAAGVDPLLAEGISYAMEYGAIAAETLSAAFRSNDFSFGDYRQRLLTHRLGRLLQRRAWLALPLYQHRSPPMWALLWRLASYSPKWAQRGVGSSLALLPA